MTAIKQQKTEINGKLLSLQYGNWAQQAHGSVLYRSGDLMLLATVCADREPKEGQDFFPLTVDYREKLYAAGRIPGGYFKRENRPAEHETLMSRLIDRPCRPLFPEGYLCEMQLLITLISADMNVAIEGHAITAASAALMNSDIPWDGPIAGVVLGRIDGQFVVDLGPTEMEQSNLNLLVAGSKEAITMIEGDAQEYSNEEMLEALAFAHQALKEKLNIQEELARSIDRQKREVVLSLLSESLAGELHDYAYPKMQVANRTVDKTEREEAIKKVYKEALQHFEQKLSAEDHEGLPNVLRQIEKALHEIEYLAVRSLIFEEEKRADGRHPQEIRSISVEIDPLPSAHGSAVFTRGQTQSLGVVTLGTKLDNQRYETLEGQKTKNFMLHYNFPPFSTGEVKRAMGPGRREIGHGNLALRALKHVLPDEKDFPYVIRIVSEILESNGSSSMASVCSASLALMTAGVPIRRAVSGIAMGLMTNDKGEVAILSDIAGIEDHFGDMDFKLAGTEKGITAFQLDLKVKGISIDILRQALEQAEKGRLHILQEMNKAIANPKPELPEGAPRITSLQIDTDRIGELIGPGGRIIKTIIEKTGAEVNVEDDGKVTIASTSQSANEKAEKMVLNIFRELQAGDNYEGVVKRIVDFGAFVELYPGKEGLLHISKMSHQRLNAVSDMLKEGDMVPVVVIQIDRMGRVDLIHRDLHDGSEPSLAMARSERPQRDDDRRRRGDGHHQRNGRGRHQHQRGGREGRRGGERGQSSRRSPRGGGGGGGGRY